MCGSAENYFFKANEMEESPLIASVLGKQNQPSWRAWVGMLKRERQFAGLGCINELSRGHLQGCPQPGIAEGLCDINVSKATAESQESALKRERQFQLSPGGARTM